MIREGEHITSEEIGLTWERTLEGWKNLLKGRIRIKNYRSKTAKLPLSLIFQADFEDVFAIQGLFSEKPGKAYPPAWKENELIFTYQGADECYRSVSIQFSTQPSRRDQSSQSLQWKEKEE